MKYKPQFVLALAILWAFAALCGPGAAAPDISGVWQATLKTPGGPVRRVLKIAHGAKGAWTATLYSIDESDDAIPVNAVTLVGSHITFKVDWVSHDFHRSYAGDVSADGTSIAGMWMGGPGGSAPLNFQRATAATMWPSVMAHHIAFVTVEKGVRLEVLDWGGTGRPVVLLAGLGNTAHDFFSFVPKLTPKYHVYGITRRGFGNSSAPAPTAANYSANRLGDDVLAVLDALKINRPVLAGHSIAGEELSSIGTRHPEKVSGLVYLDAGFPYAYYDASRGDTNLDLIDLKNKLDLLGAGDFTPNRKQVIAGLLQTNLPQIEKDLRAEQQFLASVPVQQPGGPLPAVGTAVLAGEQKFTGPIPVPILAIFAVPHDVSFVADPTARAAVEAHDLAESSAQANAFEHGLPTAHVVRLPHADHFVFLSNEADVLREMNSFIGALP